MDIKVEIGSLRARMDNMEKDIQNIPTRPELEAFKSVLTEMASVQKSIMLKQDEFARFITGGKSVAIVLLFLGAFVSKLIDWGVNIFHK